MVSISIRTAAKEMAARLRLGDFSSKNDARNPPRYCECKLRLLVLVGHTFTATAPVVPQRFSSYFQT